MSVPFFPFPLWIELPHAYARNLAASIEESIKTLKLADKLQTAHIPISDEYEPCPECNVWGFGPVYPTLSDSDGMDQIAHQLEVLSRMLAKPLNWVSWSSQSTSNERTLRDCINVGLYLCKHYQGQIEITVGSQSRSRYQVQLHADQRNLMATLDKLTPSRIPAVQPVKATILSVDFTRGIICTSIGAVQFNDPDVATAAFDAIGRELILWLDFNAPPLRAEIPELRSMDFED